MSDVDAQKRMAAILRANQDMPFVDRILSPEGQPTMPMGEGSVATHLMAAEIDDSGQSYAFPTVIKQPDGSLKQFTNPHEAMAINKREKNALPFLSIEDAIEFSENYKTPEFTEHYSK
jgi:hypothetical protein